MNGTLAFALGLGFVLGLKHALDPDHLVAVSTIVSEQKSVLRSSLIGTFWGIGHTAALLAVGIAVIASQRAVPPRVSEWMETGVAFMLVYLGARTMRRYFRGWRLHLHAHEHDGRRHVHLHLHPPGQPGLHLHRHLLRMGVRPFLVGTMHGLAGSGALMLLVLAALPTTAGRLAYIASFGAGSVGGMLLMSALIGLPFVFTALKFEAANHYIQFGAGALSTLFGGLLLWQRWW